MILDDILDLGIYPQNVAEAQKLVTILGQEGMPDENIKATLLAKFPTTPWVTSYADAKNFSQKKEDNANGKAHTWNADEDNPQEHTESGT